MTDSSESSVRVKGVTIIKQIVYGSVSRYLGKKREEDGHTHNWTVFVRPFVNEDLSVFIKKVQFKLHDSYANPLRVITRPPYEVSETGWGEFEVIIKIFFHDASERPVSLFHLLKLFQVGSDVMLGKKQLVSEHFDEIIFQDPTKLMQDLLTCHKTLPSSQVPKHETNFEEHQEKTLNSILTAKRKIHHEITDLKERLKMNREHILTLKEDISAMKKLKMESLMT